MRLLAAIILTSLTLTSFAQDKDSLDSAGYIFISELLPSYSGGHAEMIKFIKNDLKYPKGSRTIKGKVYVEFIVNKNGSLSDFKVVKGLSDSFDHSALQTVRKMPNWIPAKRENKPIQTKIVIMIPFD